MRAATCAPRNRADAGGRRNRCLRDRWRIGIAAQRGGVPFASRVAPQDAYFAARACRYVRASKSRSCARASKSLLTGSMADRHRCPVRLRSIRFSRRTAKRLLRGTCVPLRARLENAQMRAGVEIAAYGIDGGSASLPSGVAFHSLLASHRQDAYFAARACRYMRASKSRRCVRASKSRSTAARADRHRCRARSRSISSLRRNASAFAAFRSGACGSPP